MIEFPVLYTFKAMGENNNQFINDVKTIFCEKKLQDFIERPSKKGNYVSVSATVEVKDYDELQSFYSSIKMVNGLKYHL